MNSGNAIGWPCIDSEVEAAVLDQLRTTTSIYDGGGIFADFEAAFGKAMGVEHVVCVSSGTAALHSAYFALGLGVGDEVLCPDYTFFATAMPLFQLGSLPVLTDCAADGTFDLAEAARLITDRTRAVVVTHMWGRPENVFAVRAFCDKYDLAMVEDCSHAHGARFSGFPVGSLADVAAWSLQESKLVPAGEGGVVASRSQSIFERILLLGHFNKRSLRQIDPESPNYRWAETGLGLKYRAHPLGIAMANALLPRVPDWLAAKRRHAAFITESLLNLNIRSIRGELPEGSVDSFYALVMTPTEEGAMVPADIVEALRRLDFTFADVPKATRPLHLYPAFIEPQSPVTKYDRPCIRGNYPNASRLANSTFKIPLPYSLDGSAIEYCKAFLSRIERVSTQGMPPVIKEPAIAEPALRELLEITSVSGVHSVVTGAIVVCCEQGRNPKLLLLRRHEHGFLGGFEDLPGGKAQSGETLLMALCREVFEETGCRVESILWLVGEFDYEANERSSRQFTFAVALGPGAIRLSPTEHIAYRWLDIDQLDSARVTAETAGVLRAWRQQFFERASPLEPRPCS